MKANLDQTQGARHSQKTRRKSPHHKIDKKARDLIKKDRARILLGYNNELRSKRLKTLLIICLPLAILELCVTNYFIYWDIENFWQRTIIKSSISIVWGLSLLYFSFKDKYLDKQKEYINDTRAKEKTFHKVDKYVALLVAYTPILVYHLLIYVTHKAENAQTTFFGLWLFFILLSSALLVFKFEQISMTILAIVTGLGFMMFTDGIHTNFIISLIGYVTLGVISSIQREHSLDRLHKSYLSYSAMVPRKVAFNLTIKEIDILSYEDVQPENRYSASLISDWRDYQRRTKKMKSEEVEALFQTYYKIVFEKLDQLNDEYDTVMVFTHWTADELFLTAYSSVSDDEAAEVVLRFAKILATEVFLEFNKVMHLEYGVDESIYFDIGINGGEGTVGLLGADRKPQLTVIGESPGIAKRFQEEAKAIRKENPLLAESAPIILTDKHLRDKFIEHNILKCFSVRTSVTKDLDGQECYYCIPMNEK